MDRSRLTDGRSHRTNSPYTPRIESLEDRLTPAHASPLILALTPVADVRALATTSPTPASIPQPADYPWSGWVDLGSAATDLEIIQNQDGRLEAFVLRSDGSIANRWQRTPGGSWTAWTNQGTNMKSVAVARNADGRLEIFAIGKDNALYTKAQTRANGAWGSWVKTSGNFKSVEAYSQFDGRLELYLIGNDNALFQRSQTGPNGRWQSTTRIGGAYQKVRFALNADGRGEMLALTTTGQLSQRWQTRPGGSWSTWRTFQTGVADFDLALTSDGRLEAYAVTTTGALMQRAQRSPNSGWGSWSTVGSKISQVDLVIGADGRSHVFAQTTEGRTVARSLTVSATARVAWEDLGPTRRILAVSSNTSGRLELFVNDARGRLAQRREEPIAITADNPSAWNLNAMKVPDVWARGYTGDGIIVAVLDTGVDRTHPDLASNIWRNLDEIPNNGIDDDGNGFIDDVYGWDFAQQDNTPDDLNGHGTHVAGIIAGVSNGIGITGLAPEASIMRVQVLRQNGEGSSFDIDRGIRYAVDNGAKVINISIGGAFNNSAVANAITYARSKGVLIVAGAGNDTAMTPSYPAAYSSQFDNVLSVSAHDSKNIQTVTSNHVGSSGAIQVDAPGDTIYSTTLQNGYRNMSGTSMASPHVAALAALILSANPNLTPQQVRSIIVQSADRVIADSDARGGVDAAAAIDLALSGNYRLV